MFDHFLITRFNVREATWRVTRSGKKVLTEEWLNQRFELFEKFTLPSVLNQSIKNFHWLIYFGVDTPEFYRKKAIALQAHSFIKVFFIEGMHVFLENIEIGIDQFGDKGKQFLITTRLDNDDLVHKNFIKTIQEKFIPQNGTLIDLRRGYQLNIENGKNTVRHFFDFYSHFLSLVEDAREFKTIFSRQIEGWEMEKKVQIYNAEALFIEIVHGENMVNCSMLYMPYTLSFRAGDFGIDNKVLKLPGLLWRIFMNRKYYYKKILSKLKIQK